MSDWLILMGKISSGLHFLNMEKQVYSPKFSPDGKFVIFDCSYHQGKRYSEGEC